MNKINKNFLYIIFAIISTISNLLTQRLILSIDESYLLFFIALFFGTLVGLVVKFFLDKRWIFNYKNKSLKLQTRKFFHYSLMGVFSTSVFWVTETLFWLVWKNDFMREIGALLGLSVGYYVKYKLDKYFVFK